MGRLIRRAAIFLAPIIINKVFQKFKDGKSKDSNSSKRKKK